MGACQANKTKNRSGPPKEGMGGLEGRQLPNELDSALARPGRKDRIGCGCRRSVDPYARAGKASPVLIVDIVCAGARPYASVKRCKGPFSLTSHR